MSLSDLFTSSKPVLSFELFPPKTPAGEKALWKHVDALAVFKPDFITCTYGAGGSTQGKTLDIVTQVKQRYQIPVATHLTCVGSSVDQLRDYLTEVQQREIDYVVALRGDPPAGDKTFRPTPGGLRYANELVTLIRSEFPHFDIVVAGYPETHQEAPSPQADIENLQRKVAAGADVVVTQLFYDNNEFFAFRDKCQAAGIGVPLIPGLMPVTNLSQIQRITSMCGAKLPKAFIARLSEKEDDTDWQFDVGVEQAARQAEELLAAGVPGMHFYVLNRSKATSRVLDSLASSWQ